jgi:tRNA pseudouridine13 synthase
VAEWFKGEIGTENLAGIELKTGILPVPTRVPGEKRALWESLVLPLPSARLKPEIGAAWLPYLEKVLRVEGLTLPELRIKGMQKPFFSKGDRAACLRPANLSSETGIDELNSRKQKLVLKFELPRGCYATMLIKRITATVTFPPPISPTPDP